MFPRTLRSEGITLRVPRVEDAGTLFERYTQDPEVTRYLSWKPHSAEHETAEFLGMCAERWEMGPVFNWVIETEGREGPWGMISVTVKGHVATFGYCLARPLWGQGLMSRSLRAVLEASLKQEALYRFWAYCHVDNTASARVMEKAGLELEGRLRRYSLFPNLAPLPQDVFSYARGR